MASKRVPSRGNRGATDVINPTSAQRQKENYVAGPLQAYELLETVTRVLLRLLLLTSEAQHQEAKSTARAVTPAVSTWLLEQVHKLINGRLPLAEWKAQSG